jgi:DNA-binding CsgD family transcriptional regulator
VPDTSHPYELPEMDAYARERGWPDDILKLWWSRHLALKMPFYIRCRFEHLPFVASIDQKRHRNPARVCPEEAQITAILRDMGIRTMLVLPLHLSKGRVAMVVWAGARKASEVLETIEGLEGDLLAVGYHFMRIANHSLGAESHSGDERSRLTPREWDCALTLAQGYREAEIAELIGIKKVTVRFHLDNVVQKFGCKTRTHAVALLAQLGLLGPIGT